MSPKLRRVSVLVSWVLLAYLGAASWTVYARAQNPDVDRRLNALEHVDAEHRLTAIETELSDLSYLAKAILVVVSGQLVMTGLNLRGRKFGRGERR